MWLRGAGFRLGQVPGLTYRWYPENLLGRGSKIFQPVCFSPSSPAVMRNYKILVWSSGKKWTGYP